MHLRHVINKRGIYRAMVQLHTDLKYRYISTLAFALSYFIIEPTIIDKVKSHTTILHLFAKDKGVAQKLQLKQGIIKFNSKQPLVLKMTHYCQLQTMSDIHMCISITFLKKNMTLGSKTS